MLESLTIFFNTFVLGPDRAELVAASLPAAADRAMLQHHREEDVIRRRPANVNDSMDNLIRALERTRSPGSQFAVRTEARIAELDHEATKLGLQLRDHQAAAPVVPADNVELLDQLPIARIDLNGLSAEHSGPGGRSCGQRRWSHGGAAVIVLVAALVVTLGASWLARGHGSRGAVPAAGPTATSVFMCGESVASYHMSSTRSDLSMSIMDIHRPDDGGAPDISVTFTAPTYMKMRSSPPTIFEILYLRDDTIVGGGPMLNPAGDFSRQFVDEIGYGFPVYPGRANVLDLGRREQLCAPLTWREVWADPGRYEALVLQGHIEEVTDGFHLLSIASPLDVSLLASRVPLAQ